MSVLSKFRILFGAAVVAALLAGFVPTAYAQGGGPSSTPYYLALGDSLSQGVQPTTSGQSVETNRGYVDDLYTVYRREVPGLQLAKLGCPGETTGTMIQGGGCHYSAGNQLAQAVAFLETHRVVVVTLDIGANNVDDCVTGSTIDDTCILKGVTAAKSDLPTILATLQAAAPGVPIVGMNYYDPFLAAWLQGTAGRVLAVQSVTAAVALNGVLDGGFAHFGDKVADVQTTFQTTNWTALPFLGVPLNVGLICALTWMCAPAPEGPNIHANAFGYAAIAATFFHQLPHV
jgi:lysophospholipase L1-like esterase